MFRLQEELNKVNLAYNFLWFILSFTIYIFLFY